MPAHIRCGGVTHCGPLVRIVIEQQNSVNELLDGTSLDKKTRNAVYQRRVSDSWEMTGNRNTTICLALQQNEP